MSPPSIRDGLAPCAGGAGTGTDHLCEEAQEDAASTLASSEGLVERLQEIFQEDAKWDPYLAAGMSGENWMVVDGAGSDPSP